MWSRRLSGRCMSTNPLRELAIPRAVVEGDKTQEFIRFWVSDGYDHVSMNIGGFEDNANEAWMWGNILADIAWHAVNGMSQSDASRGTPKQMLKDIMAGYQDRIEDKPKLTGELGKENAH